MGREVGKTDKQRGHLMLALIVAIALLSIGMERVAQKWEDYYRREMEAEMMFRAGEISRAIFRYRQDRANQPLVELKLLLEPGSKGQYFIRRLYEDPLVRDGKWGLLYQGPNNTIIDPNSAQPGAGDFRLGSDTLPQQTGAGGLQGGFSQGPQEIAGLPIIGVKSLCTDRPFRIYKDQTEYSEWKFTIFDVMQQTAPAVPGQQAPPGAAPNAPRKPSPGG